PPGKKRPAPRGTAFYRRQRANNACQVCRSRKTKCDNAKPSCSFCLKVGATCVQSPVDLSSFDPASLRILERLDELEQVMRSTSHSNTPLPSYSLAEASPSSEPSRTSLVTGEPGSPLPYSLDTLLGQQEFCIGPNAEQPYHALVSWRNTSQGATPASLGPGFDLESQSTNLLLENFFNYVHCKNPIFEEAETRQLVTRIFLEGIDWSAEACLALLICALGSIAQPFGSNGDEPPHPSVPSSADGFFKAAQKRMGVILTSSDIIGPQCLFLAGIYMMCIFQPVSAWRFFNQTLAACQDLGFLAEFTYQSPVGVIANPSSMELGISSSLSKEQAIFWSAWKSERELRRTFNFPSFPFTELELTNYPQFFPTPPGDKSLIDSHAAAWSHRERISWYFYLSEISLRRLNLRFSGEIIEMYRRRGPRDFLDCLAASVEVYEAEVQSWIDSLPPEVGLAGPVSQDTVCNFVLRGQLLHVYELVYWPFLLAALRDHSPMGHDIAFPELIQKGIDLHLQHLYVNEPGFRHRHHGTFLMIGACARSSLVLLLVARWVDRFGPSGPRGVVLPPSWKQAVWGVVNMLRYWESDAPAFGTWKEVIE
ncbi:hypothetical protein GQ53DRAFT_629904, partial [Thozetella sp. PMI_491]